MKSRVYFACILLISLSACNGRRTETRSALERMLGSRIQLPKEILCVYEGEESEASAEFRKKPKLLVYVDSVNCGECQISKFYRFEEIREEGIKTGDYDVVLLLSPKQQEKESLIEKAKLFYMSYPVYIDVNNEFLSRNETVPESSQYHTMYIGKDGRVKMVGDPTAGEKIKEVFDRVNGQ